MIRRVGGDIWVAEKEGKAIGCVQAHIDIRLAEGMVGEVVSLVVSQTYQEKKEQKVFIKK